MTYVGAFAKQFLRGRASLSVELTEGCVQDYEGLHRQHVHQQIKSLRAMYPVTPWPMWSPLLTCTVHSMLSPGQKMMSSPYTTFCMSGLQPDESGWCLWSPSSKASSIAVC